jgi:hypothetical protein
VRSVLKCPAGPLAEQIIGKFSVVATHVSECHGQPFHPLLRGRTEWFGGGLTLLPLGVGL